MKEYKTWMLTKKYAAERLNEAIEIESAIDMMYDDEEIPEKVTQDDFSEINEHHSLFTDEYMLACAADYRVMFEEALMDKGDRVCEQEYHNIWLPRARAFITDRLKDLAEAEKELNERLFNQGE